MINNIYKQNGNNRTEVILKPWATSSFTSPVVSGTPAIILKQAKTSIVDPLVQILNSCITQKIFLREWKTAIVTPLYKSKGDTCDLNNYRDISVLPPLAKFFEKLLSARLRAYFESKRFLLLVNMALEVHITRMQRFMRLFRVVFPTLMLI